MQQMSQRVPPHCESEEELAVTGNRQESTPEDTLDIHSQPQSLFHTIENSRFPGLSPNTTTSIETVAVAVPAIHVFEIENQESYSLSGEDMAQMTIQYALSVLQKGKLPRILSPDLIEETFKSENPRPLVKNLRSGLDFLVGIASMENTFVLSKVHVVATRNIEVL
ncbi:hypothetical protein KUTeg_007517 [Tegillarca granosa]|uniref:Uncharacterized protein n=1 Tax=Tegillarca granosa TaxID=220873 RepID=A0ABQ9FDF8_TEGGR|nr:hypothetical protein KUTeg_007517 [Tegillarca granosa]